jgi:ribonuclease P protein component
MKKQYRVKKNEDFSAILSKKQSFANRSFVVYYKKNEEEHTRVGISVSKKVGNAVLRNKVKRQVRMIVNEIFDFQYPMDYVIIIRKVYVSLSYEENKKEMAYIYQKINKRMER